MVQRNPIARLKNDLYSDNKGKALKASDQLAEIGGKEVIEFFISLLDQDNARLRDLAVLGLREIADSQALNPLLKAINKSENQNYNGTMAYALESLDCSRRLPEIFELLFYDNAKVKMAATTILEEQTFYFTKQDLLGIQSKWHEIKNNPDTSPSFKDYKKDIEKMLDKYSEYFEDRKASR